MEPRPQPEPIDVRRIGLGPLGWGLASLLCNLAFVPTVLAVITGLATLRDLRDAPAELHRKGARGEAWVGVVLGLFWPVVLTASALATAVLVPDEFWAGVREAMVEGMEHQGGIEEESPVAAAEPADLLTLPSGHVAGSARPLLVWLHGYGSNPDLVAEPYFERLAEAYGLAILGVSGPLQWDPGEDAGSAEAGFVWHEKVTGDGERLWAAVASVSEQVRPQDGRIVLLGFSQGAAVAAELAALHRTRIAGAIMLSPGTFKPDVLSGFSAREGPAQRFVISVGAGEESVNLQAAADYRDRLRELDVEVEHREVEGQNEHSFPGDFYASLPGWIERLLEPRGGIERVHTEPELVEAALSESFNGWIAEGYATRDELLSWALEEIGETSSEQVPMIAALMLETKLQARKELERSWPRVTDCDRLDRAFAALEARGILARQHYEDCGTCAVAAIGAELEEAKARGDAVRGYVFYHFQDTERAAQGEGLYLSYGASDGDDAAGLEIGREIVKALQTAGLKTEWDGTIQERIAVRPLDWKRRMF